MMNSHLFYWTFVAFVLLSAAIGCGATGLAMIRRGRVAWHRRLMLIATALIGAFLLSYVVKLFVLGREDLGSWSPAFVTVLRIHELLMLTMVVSGATALALGRKMLELVAPAVLSLESLQLAPEPLRARHRWAGRVALGSALLGLLTATVVLIGMYARAAV